MKRFTNDRGDLFQKERLSDYISSLEKQIKEDIDKEDANYILNVNETTYTEYLKNKYEINIPSINFDNPKLDSYEAEIPIKYLPYYSRYGQEGSYFQHVI